MILLESVRKTLKFLGPVACEWLRDIGLSIKVIVSGQGVVARAILDYNASLEPKRLKGDVARIHSKNSLEQWGFVEDITIKEIL